ncbi:hypothetical protein BKA69DRAFT_1086475 [Paraphysoderma sedebokerense]|nr:hypothetical protein BKA69DRAFT_1086475 [Paraphysoderma sedebokerense]
MRLNWPEPLLHLFSWLAFINLNVELASPECLVAEQSFNFSFKMKLSLAIPLIALALALFMPVINHVVNLFKGSTADFERRNSQTSVRTIRAYMSVLSLLFVHVATNSLALFDCTLEADGFSYLDADPSLRCYESWYYQDLPYGYAGLGLYVLGIPFMNLIISYASLLARPNPARANSVGQKFQLFCVKLMSSGHEFKSDYQFISVVQLFQKLSMVVVNIFFTRYIGFQIIITLFFLFSSVLIVFHYRPYEFPILNKFDILSNAASMVVLGLGLTFHFDRLSNSVHGLVVIICIIMVICGFILWAIVAIVWESVSSLELVARLSAYRKSNASTRKADVTGLEVAKSSKALLL